jgi:hypothetical protein
MQIGLGLHEFVQHNYNRIQSDHVPQYEVGGDPF